ncbi:hypothetical protein [Streptomyces sp. RKAG337]|uniref:hypothetical protein n=1 Tax=Streptomyces sp. RKAG337 TaxID=2893404 RepID=UPI00203437F3|nr:hypothetical protein [Streptomyces sp. RKAG337]MCM2425158.1 hypothetical protein [Streptomyces sp. RKAG337]
MAVHEHPQQRTGFHLSARHRVGTSAESGTAQALAAMSTSARVLAGIRVLTGFIFLWAFLDKAFGWGYATSSGKGWVDGGSPTKGFLSGVSAGPMESTFHSWAGAGWANWLFMLGLLSIGVALTAGVALRFAAVAGTAMMGLMWMAEWPPARHASDGSLSMSSNPLVDYHLLYAAVMIALAVASAGTVWGLGRIWARLPVVRDHRWLL